MLCPSCKHENRAERKFCVHCGAGLDFSCPSCSARAEQGSGSAASAERRSPDSQRPPPLQAQALTPRSTPADKILRSKSTLEGERKHVTVLFADVKGGTRRRTRQRRLSSLPA